MYLVDIKGLKRDLAANRVTNYEIAIYLFLMTWGGFPIWYFSEKPEKFSLSMMALDFGVSAAGLVVAYLGFRACYYVNGGLSGPSFADRFVAIAFVVSLRLSLMLVPIILAAFWFAEPESAKVFALPMLVLEAVFFWRVYVHLSDLPGLERRAA